MKRIYTDTSCSVMVIGAFLFFGASAAQAQSTASEGVPDIIVTARKIAERSQDVPLSIQAFSGDELKRRQLDSGFELQKGVSGLTVSGTTGTSNGRATPSFSIRGQSSASVALYYGGLVLPADNQGRTNGMLSRNFWDLESIQVAKGPQGTLTGKNATGGAIFFEPHRPEDGWSGFATAAFDTLEKLEIRGMVNTPIVADKVLLRAGFAGTGPGFTKNLTPGGRDLDNTSYYLGRVSLLIRPSDFLENLTLATYYRSREADAGWVATSIGIPATCTRSVAIACLYPQAVNLPAQVDRRHTVTYPGVNPYFHETSLLIANTTNIELSDAVHFKNIFGYQKQNLQNLNNTHGTNTGYTNNYFTSPRDYFSDELQIQLRGKDNKFNLVAGIYVDSQRFLRPKAMLDYLGNPIPTFYGNHFYFLQGTPIASEGDQLVTRRPNKSQALFVNMNYDLSEIVQGLGVTAGYRYSWQKITNVASNLTNFRCSLNASLVGINLSNCTATQVAKFNAPTWTFGLNYHLTPNFMLYGSVSRGYREGGFNVAAPSPQTVVYAPELVTSYEGGIKSDTMFGSVPLRLNVSGYYLDYSDIQRTTTVFSANGLPNSVVQNVATGRVYGGEAEATIKPMPNWQLTAAYAYTNSRYTEYTILNSSGALVDLSGTPFANAPKHTLTLSTTYDVPIKSEIGDLAITASYYRRSSIYFSSDGAVQTRDGSLQLVDARADLSKIGGTGLSAAIFVKNVFNKAYPFSLSYVSSRLSTAELYAPPRTAGLEVRFAF